MCILLWKYDWECQAFILLLLWYSTPHYSYSCVAGQSVKNWFAAHQYGDYITYHGEWNRLCVISYNLIKIFVILKKDLDSINFFLNVDNIFTQRYNDWWLRIISLNVCVLGPLLWSDCIFLCKFMYLSHANNYEHAISQG